MATNADLDLFLERTVDVPPSFVWDALDEARDPEALVLSAPVADGRRRDRSRARRHLPHRACAAPTGPSSATSAAISRSSRIDASSGPARSGRGYRPQVHGAHVPFAMTAIIGIEPTSSGGTKYTVTVLHGDVSGREKHEAMGFHQGWNAAFDQLVAMASNG